MLVAMGLEQEEAFHAQGLVDPAPVQMRALIDTGGELTCIPESVVSRLQLDIRSYRWCGGYDVANGPRQHPTASVRIISRQGAARIAVEEAVVIADDLSANVPCGIIGRDVLAQCLLKYDGMSGAFELMLLS